MHVYCSVRKSSIKSRLPHSTQNKKITIYIFKVFNNNADLSGISDEPLAVDEAVQEAFIEVIQRLVWLLYRILMVEWLEY